MTQPTTENAGEIIPCQLAGYLGIETSKVPEYFMLDETGDTPRWVPVDADRVPRGLGLKEHDFPVEFTEAIVPYETPDHRDSCWKSPGPACALWLCHRVPQDPARRDPARPDLR